jgi:AcrR family transcriptional regulator
MSIKKSILIDTALRMFYKFGIHAVGINEILKESGVAKKTLYNHFKSKDELIIATLIRRDINFKKWFENALSEVTPGEKAILNVFQALDHWFNSETKSLGEFRGCFFINTSAEYEGINCDIYEQCKNHKLQIRELIYQHAKITCHSTQGANELTNTICILKEGCISTAFVQKDLNAAKKMIPVISNLFATYNNKN